MHTDAVISPCGKYRYVLSRTWDYSLPFVMFIMLNPSTADEKTDDPTIRRCISFAKSWGYGGLYVCNLCPFRSSNPKDLLTATNPYGIRNHTYIEYLLDSVEEVVCAWGNEPVVKKLFKFSSPLELLHPGLDKLSFIELSINGVPKHPLYLKSELKTTKFDKNELYEKYPRLKTMTWHAEN